LFALQDPQVGKRRIKYVEASTHACLAAASYS
jgi:hypothetical protein